MFARELRAVTLTLVAYACAFVTLGLIVLEFATLPRGAILAAGGPDSEWVEVVKPFPAFAMTVPDFEDAARYTSFRHANGGGRPDGLTPGRPSSAGPPGALQPLPRG